uniref:response regulator transcription factor n=1 Tax=uncultured Caulobacter sp. TaxID=158749 RepID=UPI0025E2001D|nr:helix-turn-helix transcriptional regulator [uncultured Caulobacter sp.]
MIERLTDRERQILDLASQHLTSKQIGPLLGIRPASVDTFMQTIIRKLGVASRKEAVIAYIAAVRELGMADRDDLDFGSSPVAGPVASRQTGGVTRDGDQGPLPASDPAFSDAKGETWGAHAGRMRPRSGRLLRWSLRTPARRLVAIAIAAMILGLVTLGAAAVAYGLNQAFDRMLDDHGNHQNGRSGQSQSTHNAELDWGAYRHTAIFG